jgi:hypothetical protein
MILQQYATRIVHGRMARGQWPIRAGARDHVEVGPTPQLLDAK